jgi:branched-chain amino acid transport system substrate-binding protein
VPGGFSVHAWASGLVLREALDGAGDCVNKDTVRAALESMKDFDTGGLTGPISFDETHHLGNVSNRLLVGKGGAWVPASDYLQAQG